MTSSEDLLIVEGAREHNLKDVTLQIPRKKIVVFTGLSGSGKSSLAFDTIYAEGQRRYIESFGAYARQFIGKLERPDVDKISGLSPVISIEQKTVNRSPRSTVGTITEIYDFLRLLFARAANAYSYNTNELMIKYSDNEITKLIMERFEDKKVLLMSPVVKGRKGHYRELFEKIRKQGYTRARVDGQLVEIEPRMQLDRYKTHDIEIVIDRIEIKKEAKKRIYESLKLGLQQGKGVIMIQASDAHDITFFSRHLMCPSTGISYDDPSPNNFSFNSPYGACRNCNGLGEVSEVALEKIIPNNKLSIRRGAIAPLGEYKKSWIFGQIETIATKFEFSLSDPISNISDEAINMILYGSNETFSMHNDALGLAKSYSINFEGVINFLIRQNKENPSKAFGRWAESFMNKITCPTCSGDRLVKESLHFKFADKNISDVSQMDIQELEKWVNKLENTLAGKQKIIATEILKEIKARVGFLLEVGLDYLTLDRSAKTLSGGEAQRIRLATQIGSQLTDVLYILDEPSIGLHQRDNSKLIKSLINLRDIGNSIIVVEHDKEMIETADYVVDIGPYAGKSGGHIVGADEPKKLLKLDTLTADYLSGRKEISVPKKRRKPAKGKLILKGASGNNLKAVDLTVPLKQLISVTGVSGSGKSTLINETLYPILSQFLYRSVKKPLAYTSFKGLDLIDKVIDIDQSPIGRTPRSNPATYTGVFTDIRTLFSTLPEAKIRGYKPGRFSFNVKGGRCETCKGGGIKTIEMNFLPDVFVECEDCRGRRYNSETLEVRYKGKSINDVLNMTIEETVIFFEHIPSIHRRISTLKEVGLGYVSLGQPSTTLSGGEAQRVKLAAELSKKDTGSTFYILDEPTTGLHFDDIRMLLEILTKLVDNGNTVLVIEHNLDIVKVSDYVIDLGMEGGNRGGNIIAEGTPEEIVKRGIGYTAEYLKKELK